MQTTFKSATVLITGATGTLGAALSAAFRKGGANIIIHGRDSDALHGLEKNLLRISGSGRITPWLFDFASGDITACTTEDIGDVDILINNAAVQGPIGTINNTTLSQWESTFRINFFVPLALSRIAIPRMLAKGFGRIINISGGGSTGPRPFVSAYASSKTALLRFTENLSYELQGTGVTVNAVAPGLMASKLNQEIITCGQHAGTEEVTKAQKAMEASDNGTAQAVSLCLFLASDQSAEISGKLISAVWDKWDNWPNHAEELKNSELYTLRRVVARDKNMTWGDR